MGAPEWTKTPGEELDYVFDFAALTNGRVDAVEDCLEAGETITSATVTASDGLTMGAVTVELANTAVKVWLSGGAMGTRYKVLCHADTSAGRKMERYAYMDVQER